MQVFLRLLLVKLKFRDVGFGRDENQHQTQHTYVPGTRFSKLQVIISGLLSRFVFHSRWELPAKQTKSAKQTKWTSLEVRTHPTFLETRARQVTGFFEKLAPGRIQIRATLVGGERFHCCVMPAPLHEAKIVPKMLKQMQSMVDKKRNTSSPLVSSRILFLNDGKYGRTDSFVEESNKTVHESSRFLQRIMEM